MKKIHQHLAIFLVCLLIFPLSCSKPPKINQIFENTPIFDWGRSEREKLEIELSKIEVQISQKQDQLIAKKEKTLEEIANLQNQLQALYEKYEKTKKFLQFRWLNKP